MFCFKCGKEIPDDAIFCPKCGTAQNSHSDMAENSDAKKQINIKKTTRNSNKRAFLVLFMVICTVIALYIVYYNTQLRKASDLLNRMEYDRAREKCEVFIKVNPFSIKAYTLLSEIYQAQYNFESAKDSLDEGYARTKNKGLYEKLMQVNEELLEDKSEQCHADTEYVDRNYTTIPSMGMVLQHSKDVRPVSVNKVMRDRKVFAVEVEYYKVGKTSQNGKPSKEKTRKYEYNYDSMGRIISRKDLINGSYYELSCDPHGTPQIEYIYDSNGDLKEYYTLHIDGSGYTISSEHYEPDGSQTYKILIEPYKNEWGISTTDEKKDNIEMQKEMTWCKVNDVGNIIKAFNTDEQGTVFSRCEYNWDYNDGSPETVFFYEEDDDQKDYIMEYFYNSARNIERITIKEPSPLEYNKIEVRYDNLGNTIKWIPYNDEKRLDYYYEIEYR